MASDDPVMLERKQTYEIRKTIELIYQTFLLKLAAFKVFNTKFVLRMIRWCSSVNTVHTALKSLAKKQTTRQRWSKSDPSVSVTDTVLLAYHSLLVITDTINDTIARIRFARQMASAWRSARKRKTVFAEYELYSYLSTLFFIYIVQLLLPPPPNLCNGLELTDLIEFTIV